MYDRMKTYEYAKKWAFRRNPKYYNYDAIGGDCTNFVSQCIFAGYGQMNYNKVNGWYYINGNDKSPSWTGVEFLYDFLISNKGIGPKGINVDINKLGLGDVIQLSFNKKDYTHSLIVVQNGTNLNNTFIAAHTYDTFGKSLSEYYDVKEYRYIHILNY